MDGTGFLKTVSFGGFDKKDVLAYVDELNTKIYTLQAELDEKTALVNAQGESTADTEKYEKLLAADKQKITELQTNNDSLKNQIKTVEDESAAKDKEIEELKKKNADLEAELVDAKNKAAAAASGATSAMDLTNVFMQAQNTANSIVTQAKENARKMDEDAKRLANQVVDDANSKASTIVKTADEKATKILSDAGAKSASIIADAEDKSAEMRAAAADMKATVLDEVSIIDSNIIKIRASIEAFVRESAAKIDETQRNIADAREAFNEGKIPPAYLSSLSRPISAKQPAPAPAPAKQPAPAPRPAPAGAPKAAPSVPQPSARPAAAPQAAQPAPAPAEAEAPKPAADAVPSPKPILPHQAKRPMSQPKVTPKINFDLSEIENMAKAIEDEAAKGRNAEASKKAAGFSTDDIDPKKIRLSDMDK